MSSNVMSSPRGSNPLSVENINPYSDGLETSLFLRQKVPISYVFVGTFLSTFFRQSRRRESSVRPCTVYT